MQGAPASSRGGEYIGIERGRRAAAPGAGVPVPNRRPTNQRALLLTCLATLACSLPLQGRFSKTPSLPALCECLRKAALDPRIVGVVVKVEPLAW